MEPSGLCIEPLASAVSCLASCGGPPVAVGFDIGRPPTVFMLELGSERSLETLAGFTAPSDWHAFGFSLPVRTSGTNWVVLADRCGLLFECRDNETVDLASCRSPKSIPRAPEEHAFARARDIATLAVGQPTASPEISARELAAILMLDWQLVHSIDPDAPPPVCPLPLPDAYETLRRWIVLTKPPGALELLGEKDLVRWLDDGALARWVVTSLPELGVLRRALADLGVAPIVDDSAIEDTERA